MQQLQNDANYPGEEGAAPVACFYAVLTRFNVRAMRDKVGIASRDDLREWLHHRVPVFRDLCLASLAAQQRTPDLWLIAFDGTERALVADVLAMIAGHPWIVPVWQDDDADGLPEDFKLKFADEIVARLAPHHSHVISSRVDNDDALATGFCANTEAYAQAVLSRQPGLRDFWVSFPLGAQMIGDRFQLYPYTTSPFVSRCTTRALLEAKPKALVNHVNHNKVYERGRVVFQAITTRPSWLQVIHGRNVSNKRKPDGTMLEPADAVRGWFGLASPVSSAATAPDAV